MRTASFTMVIYQQTTITLVAERKNRRFIRPIEVSAGDFEDEDESR